jgi:hypothetical protein
LHCLDVCALVTLLIPAIHYAVPVNYRRSRFQFFNYKSIPSQLWRRVLVVQALKNRGPLGIRLGPNDVVLIVVCSNRCVRATGNSYPLSPGGRYLIGEAFCRAASVSSTVSNGVVCRELRAPPALIAIAVAAIETLSGASHKLYAS